MQSRRQSRHWRTRPRTLTWSASAGGQWCVVEVSRNVGDANDTKSEDAKFLGLTLKIGIDQPDDS